MQCKLNWEHSRNKKIIPQKDTRNACWKTEMLRADERKCELKTAKTTTITATKKQWTISKCRFDSSNLENKIFINYVI